MKKFLFSFFISVFMFMFLSGSSFAQTITLSCRNGVEGVAPNGFTSSEYVINASEDDRRFCVIINYSNEYNGTKTGSMFLYSNSNQSVSCTTSYQRFDINGNATSGVSSTFQNLSFQYIANGVYYYTSPFINNSFTASCPIFYNIDEAYDYLRTGTLPSAGVFDESLRLDSFKVNTYGVLYYLFVDDRYGNFIVEWSNPLIYTVKVNVESTRQSNSFLYSNSPGSQKFKLSDYAQENGDVIKLVATPYKANGAYGPSLYYNFTYNGNGFLTNNYRKLFKTNHIDNTIDIPYTGPSGNDTYEVPVDGVGENICYEVDYNPVTNNYGDLNLYEVYYSPVVVYPEDTPQEVIDDTQEQIINNYTTNNYYETVNHFGTNVNFNYDDVSTNDIDTTYHDITGIFSGLANLLGKLVNLLVGLLPGLSPFVATVIIVGFGIIIGAAIIALIIKVVQVIADILPF